MLDIGQLIIKEGVSIIAIRLQCYDFCSSKEIGQYLVPSASIVVEEQDALGLPVHQTPNILLCVL